jgi:hypothetical protein
VNMTKFQLADFFTPVSDSLFNAFFVIFYSQPEDALFNCHKGPLKPHSGDEGPLAASRGDKGPPASRTGDKGPLASRTGDKGPLAPCSGDKRPLTTN